MPDTRRQRGPHPKDASGFSEPALAAVRSGVDDLCFLLTRGYSHRSALDLVGNRYQLTTRQRKLLQRCAASDQAVARRTSSRLEPAAVASRELWVDGYNVLLTVEAAMSGGLVLLARDGTFRDLASLSRHYRRVDTTRPALEAIAAVLEQLGIERARWLLDRPISNSGRLKGIMDDVAAEQGVSWQVDLVADPDRALKRSQRMIATADSAILDVCQEWLNLARLVVERRVEDAWLVEL